MRCNTFLLGICDKYSYFSQKILKKEALNSNFASNHLQNTIKPCIFAPLEPAKPLHNAQIGGSYFLYRYMKTNYPKHYSSPTQIIQLLKNNRRMVITDEAKAERYLTNISYHRLSAYIFPFYQIPKTNLLLKSGTTFEKVLTLYRFDKKLRLT